MCYSLPKRGSPFEWSPLFLHIIKKSHFYLQIQKVVVYLHYTSCLIHKEYYKYGERCNDN